MPGPEVSDREARTYTYLLNKDGRLGSFKIDALMLLPEAKKAIFHSHQYLGEISLENYPFQRDSWVSDLKEVDSNPLIKMYDVHSFKV